MRNFFLLITILLTSFVHGQRGFVKGTNDTIWFYDGVNARVQVNKGINSTSLADSCAAVRGTMDGKAPLASPAFTGTPTGITAAHVGLPNVNNTSDANKPVSTAQQTALDLKQNIAGNTGGWTEKRVSGSAATNGTTSLADITGLVSNTLTNSTKYEIEVVIDATVSAVTTGITYSIATGGTGGASVVNVLVTGTSTTNAGAFYTIATAGAATSAFVTSSGANGLIKMTGFVTTRGSGTATISVQMAKPTSGTATAQVGSVLRYRLAS